MDRCAALPENRVTETDSEKSGKVPLDVRKQQINDGEISELLCTDEIEITTKRKLPSILILSTLSVTVGASIQYGYNMGVLSVPSVHMKIFFNQSHHKRHDSYLEEHASRWLWSFTVALFCVGAAVGSLVSSYPSNKLGRKITIMLNNLFSILGALLMSTSYLASSYEMVILGRFLAGIHVGIVTAVVPIYLSEISPTALRGIIGTMHGVLINIGISLSQAFGLYVFRGENDWPWLLGLPPILFSLFQVFSFAFCPESPRWWMINQKNEKKAAEALQRLRKASDIQAEIREMQVECSTECTRERVRIMDLLCLRRKEWRRPLALCIVCNCCLHLTGVNAIWFYLVEIMQSTGLSFQNIIVTSVWLGAGNAVVTAISGYSLDRFGRRPLIIGSLVMCISLLCSLTVTIQFQSRHEWLPWLSVVLVSVHTFFVSFGPGSAPFILGTEIWSQAPRSAAMSLGSQASWMTNFFVGLLFPVMQDELGHYCFLVFAAVLAVIAVYFYFSLPETKNRTFEDISSMFRKKAGVDTNDPIKNTYISDEKEHLRNGVSI